MPNRLPSARKLPFAARSTRSAPADGQRLERADVELVGDLAAQLLARAGSHADDATRARRSGCRVRTLASARAARPSSTSRRASDICAPQLVVDQAAVDPRPGGQVHRLGQLVEVAANTSCHTRSVMNGVIGAISSVTTYRHSCSVASADGSPAQKRRRERRTYQLDRSSTYAASSDAGPLGVEDLERLGDARRQPVRLGERPPVQHRPVGERRAPGRPGDQPDVRA